MEKQIIILETVDAVIDALGGPEKVRQMTKREAASAVPMWKTRKKLPPDTYKIMQEALFEQRMTAPDHLWGML
jgi:hypothetical protein